MRADSQYVHYATDRPLLDKVPREHRTFDMQTFAVVDHIFLAGLGHDTPGLSQLSHFSERGLIGKVVSAGSHNPHAKRASFRRDCGCRDQLNLRIFKDLVKFD